MAATALLAVPTVVHAAPPSNDDIHQATVITSLPYTDRESTLDAVPDPGVASTCGSPTAGTIWYTYTPTRDGRYILASAGSDFRTTLGIVTDPDGDLGGFGCTSGAASYGALNDYHLLSGVTYYFRVSGMPEAPNGPESGSAVFILFEDASGYPVFDVDVGLVKATIGRRGQVTLHGTTTCNPTGRATTECGTRIDLTASQRVGGRLAEGSAVYEAPCDAVFNPDPTATPPKTCSWHQKLTTTTGRFKPGGLTVDINAIAYNGNGTAVDDRSTTIALTPSKRWPRPQPSANTTAR